MPNMARTRKLVYTLIALSLLAGATELALRLIDPAIFRFVYQARQVHRYAIWSKVDFRPDRRAELRLPDGKGADLFRFEVQTNDLGIRVEDRLSWETRSRAATGKTIIHCLGDSYTMGWGVSAGEAYPARLGELLGGAHLVLNLGVDGYGLIAATEKSRRVGRVWRPAWRVYLFSPNDPGDDAIAIEVRRRSPIEHEAWLFLDAARERSYLANLPFVLKWAYYFRPGRWPAAQPGAKAPDAEDIAARARATPPLTGPTAEALMRLQADCWRSDCRVLVAFTDDQPASLAALRLCQEAGLPSLVCPVPTDELLPGDGHFAPAGHRRLAEAVTARLR